MGPGDVTVASVGGRPVWASCVTAQAARARGSVDERRAVGLRECIDFELLAQAAEARGLVNAPEVSEARRTALVSRVVEIGFEDRYRTPASMQAQIDATINANLALMNRQERRLSTYVRVPVDRKATPEMEASARAVADQIYAALGSRTGLFPVDLREVAETVGTATKLKLAASDFKASTLESFEAPFGDALFALEVGRVSPPTRTSKGWDIILLTEITPPKVYTREEVAEIVFPELRRKQFVTWIGELIESLDVSLEQIGREDFARIMANPPP